MSQNTMTRSGTYIASRASLPERSATWRRLRDEDGWKITSTWIDEAGAGASPNLGQLWVRIDAEISGSERLILYVEPADFPLKGALIEVGMALAYGIPIRVVAPGVVLDPTSMRPLGSWVRHPLVTVNDTLDEALTDATRFPKKNKWPCQGKPEDLKGQPIGMYHCEFCGEMQLAGVAHLLPQFPSQWEAPIPEDLNPVEEAFFSAPEVEDPPSPVTECPFCGDPANLTFSEEKEVFPYGIAPNRVELTVMVNKGRCAACAFEFTDWRAEKARDLAVQAHLQAVSMVAMGGVQR